MAAARAYKCVGVWVEREEMNEGRKGGGEKPGSNMWVLELDKDYYCALVDGTNSTCRGDGRI